MNIFEKISNMINGTKSSNETSASNTENTSNSIDKKGDLLNAVVSLLKSNLKGAKIDLKGQILLLVIDDNLFYNSLKLGNFQDELIATINDELGLVFGAVEITSGPAPDGSITKIMDSCYLRVQPKVSVQSVSKAVVCQVEGFGTLIEDSICLDSQKIKDLPNCRYNIGSGKFPILQDGSHRENHIAIDDNPSSAEFEKNKYVSRAHAHISYNDDNGFMLFVEHGGSRAARKRTHIYRGDEKIELGNTIVPAPLHDGDYIVLSKKVQLLFKKEK